MNFKFERGGALGVLTFCGELTTERENDIKGAIMMSLDNADHVVVNLEEVTAMDSSIIELLQIIYKDSDKLNKRLTLI